MGGGPRLITWHGRAQPPTCGTTSCCGEAQPPTREPVPACWRGHLPAREFMLGAHPRTDVASAAGRGAGGSSSAFSVRFQCKSRPRFRFLFSPMGRLAPTQIHVVNTESAAALPRRASESRGGPRCGHRHPPARGGVPRRGQLPPPTHELMAGRGQGKPPAHELICDETGSPPHKRTAASLT